MSQHPLYSGDEGDQLALRLSDDRDRKNSLQYKTLQMSLLEHTESGEVEEMVTRNSSGSTAEFRAEESVDDVFRNYKELELMLKELG